MMITIENELKKSNVFLIILSPAYLNSQWCRVEFEIAFNKELEAKIRRKEYSIHVLQVKETDAKDWIFGRRYVLNDLTNLPDDQLSHRINAFIEGNISTNRSWIETKIGEAKESDNEKISKIIETIVEGSIKPRGWLPFQNRDEELHRIITSLESKDGPHFYTVIAPPQFGKSLLLAQLSKELLSTEANWIIQYCDLSTSYEARNDIGMLLKNLNFQGDQVDIEGIEELTLTAATQITKSGKYWLLLVDSGEHIGDRTAKQFRKFLGELTKRLSFNENGRVAVVIASRTDLISFKGEIPKPRFVFVELAPFSQSVISKIIRYANRDGIQLNYQDISKKLLRLTEGLPELITRYIDWMIQTSFVPEDLEKPLRYKEINEKYIENTFLTPQVLLPYIPITKIQEEVIKAWVDFILNASSFRLITRSHMRFIKSEQVVPNLPPVSLPNKDILEAFGKIHLVVPTQTMWYKIAPAIRRLLFHYHYRSNEEKLKIHNTNELLYKEWVSKLSGTDALVFTIEQFWHFVEKTRINLLLGKKPKNHVVEEYFQSLCDSLKHNGESYADQLIGLGNLMANDVELNNSLEEIQTGLSDRTISILDTIITNHHET